MLRKKFVRRRLHSNSAPFTSPRHDTEKLEPRLLLAAHIVGSTTSYSTIQAAVNAAAAGAIINVDAGTYGELVTVNKSLTIRGAQAGVDARGSTRQSSSSESVLTGANLGGSVSSSFYINANDVTIDGFIVQGNTSAGQYGAGIVIAPNRSGTHILDNIVQNNIAGLYLANGSTTDQAVVQHNVFRNNNNAGANGGRGIYTDAQVSGGTLTNVLIDSNFFLGNRGGSGTTTYESAIALESRATTPNSQNNIQITNNTFENNGKGVLAYNANNILIKGNTVTSALDKWSAGLRFEGGDTNVTIQNNNLYANTGPAVNIDAKGFAANDSGFVINNNTIYGNSNITSPIYGPKVALVVGSGQYDGTLDARNNWWGNSSGPGGAGSGSGDVILTNGNSVLFSPWLATAPVPQQSPFTGVAAIAGIPIQAENFDQGGEGIAYHDSDANNTGNQYRLTGVDIEGTNDVGGGYDIGWTVPGEWMAYTVSVTQSASYRFDFRIANGQTSASTFHMTVDGQNVTGTLTAPPTGGWQTWQTISSAAVSISAGQHVLRLVYDTGGSTGAIANFNWFQLTNVAPAPAVPAAPSNLAASASGTSQINLAWTNNATNQTGVKIDRSTDGLNFATIATVAMNVTSYSDTGLSPATTYYYRVRATGASGDSGNSNVAQATTASLNSVTYISDLQWASATVGWGTIGINTTIKGNPISLRGTTYAKGIGTHAVSQIVYNLNGQYGSFLSDVGVDDEVNGQGAVDFQVIGDGKVLFDSGVLTGASPVVHINVNVTGVKQLTLVANNGVAGSIDYDHSDWAGARLLAAAPTTTPPAAPANLAAAAVSSSQINLSWVNSDSTTTSFEIDRSIDGANFNKLATVGSSVTSYSDISLPASTTYFYRVLAINSAGTSPASNTASATTKAANSTTTYLSDLQWTSATVGWGTIQKDASIKGNPITLRGTTYAKGIGTHADSTITYNLAGKYTTFISDIGIDDEVNGQGSVIFQVIGDGKVLFNSGAVTGTSPVMGINLNVAGVQQLQLVVTTATPGNIDYDHADWAGTRLLS